jgi:hypothetical protein
LGLHECKYLLDEKTRFNVILKALNAGIQTIHEQREEKGQCPKCGAELGCEHRAMSLGTKEINEECDHDEEPPLCTKCTAIYREEMRLSLDLHPKPMEYYLNENIERWFWDRKDKTHRNEDVSLPSTTTTSKTCKECRTVLPVKARFCSECGKTQENT